MAADIHVRLESSVFSPDDVKIQVLDGVEAISRLFEFQLDVVYTGSEPLDEQALLLSDACLVFERRGEVARRIWGMIGSVSDRVNTETKYASYRLQFVPHAWRATLTETVDIFLDMTVTDAVKKKLERNGLQADKDFDLGRLRFQWPPREFVVQYKETDHNFISRWCEHLGIFYFFEHGEDAEVMVFGDDKSCFKPEEGAESVPFYANAPEGIDEMRVWALESSLKPIPGKYVVRDYNYRTPGVDLLASSTIPDGSAANVVEYGTHFKTPEEGARFARIRAEEVRSLQRVFTGKGNVLTLRSGATVKIEGHPRGDMELLLVEVRHHARQSVPGVEERSDSGEEGYRSEFRAIPKETPFRPARVTPKPRVHGVVTGVVDAANKGQYAEIDSDGRYNVKFMYDTTNPGEGQASHRVRMAQPHSGAGYGMHFPLRPGVEVILTCSDGDPDRPIIVGTVPNPSTASPVTAGNNARNVIRTGGGSEMNFDDTDGSQRLKISVPHADSVIQMGSPNAPEKGIVLSTTENYTAVAKSATSTITKVSTAVSTITGLFAEKNITNWAGAADKRSWWDKVSTVYDVASALADVGESAVDTYNKAKAIKQASLDKAAKDAKAAADEKREALQQQDYNNKVINNALGIPLAPEKNTEAYDKAVKEYNEAVAAEADAKAKEAAAPEIIGTLGGHAATEAAHQKTVDAKARLDALTASDPTTKALANADQAQAAADKAAKDYKDEDTAHWYDKAQWYVDDAKGVVDAVKGAAKTVGEAVKTGKEVRDLISKGAQALNNNSTLAANKKTGLHVASANATLRSGRLSHVVPLLQVPFFLGGSDKAAALVGKKSVFVGASASAVMSSARVACVSGGKKALVHSRKEVEIAGKRKLLITSNKKVDVKVTDGQLRIESAKRTRQKVGAGLTLEVEKTMTVKVKKNYQTTVDLRWSAKAKNFHVEAEKKFDVKAQKVIVVAEQKVLVKTAKFNVKTTEGGWMFEAKSSGIKAIGKQVGFIATSSSAKVFKASTHVTADASSVTVKGTQVKLNGTSVTVNGSKIQLG